MCDLSLKPQHKLLQKTEYQSVFDCVELRSGRGPLLALARHNTLSTPRLGLIVRKKNLKLAVDRNRVKRIVREKYRLRRHQLPCCDIIVLTRGPASHLTNASLGNLVDIIFDRLIRDAQ